MGRPVAASQSRAVLSSLPVRTVLPSGLNATALTGPWCEKTAFSREDTALPGGEAGPGGVLPGPGRRPRRPSASSRPARAGPLRSAPSRTSDLAALEVEHRQVEIGFGQRSFQVSPVRVELDVQSGDPSVRHRLLVRRSAHSDRRRGSPAPARAGAPRPSRRVAPATTGFRRHQRQARSQTGTGRARIGSPPRNRRRSSASAAAES